MPSFDIEALYGRGRREWHKYAREKRKSKAEEAALEHQRALDIANIRYGEGSPAMISARTGERIAGAEYGPGGLKERGMGLQARGVEVEESKLGLLPWQEAMKTHRAIIGAGGGGQPKRTDIQAIYKFESDENFDPRDPEWIAKANALREAAGMPLWVRGGSEQTGTNLPVLNWLWPRKSVPTYRQESEEEMRTRGGIQTYKGGAPTMAGRPYYLPSVNTPQPSPSLPPYTPQSQGYGTMRVEGTPGYYGVNMPKHGGTPISPAYPEIRRYGVTPTPTKPREKRRSLDEIFGR